MGPLLRLKVKMPGQSAYPAGPPTEFTINIAKDEKKKQKLQGLDCDAADGKHLYINKVLTGPFRDYNGKADIANQLRVGDFIMKINGKEGDAQAMLEELKTPNDFEVVVRRPEEIKIAITKKEPKAPLGIEIPKTPTGSALLIVKVGDGPFQEWNDKHGGAHQKVCDNDRIVSVITGKERGVQGKAMDIKKQM